MVPDVGVTGVAVRGAETREAKLSHVDAFHAALASASARSGVAGRVLFFVVGGESQSAFGREDSALDYFLFGNF